MDKRQPLSVMIALQSKKMRGGDSPPDDSKDDGGDDMAGDETEGKHDDPGLITACEDLLDAMKNRDSKGMNTALCHWFDIYDSMADGGEDDRN